MVHQSTTVYTRSILPGSMFPPEIPCQHCDARFGGEALWRLSADDDLLATYRCPRCGSFLTLKVPAMLGHPAALPARTPVSHSDVATVQEILRRHRGDLKSLLHYPPQHRKR